jgi:hypothetical protein
MLRTTIADLMLAKGKRGLVKKKITVTRGGRTFQTTVWVSPWKDEKKPKEAPAKPLLFEDELQTIREMLEKEFNPELIANKIERERDQMGEKPLPRKSIMNAISKVEGQLKKEIPGFGTGRRWSSVVAEVWERAKKAKEKVAPKKAVVKEEIKDPTQKEGLEGATTKVENAQMRLSKMFARVHQLQTMLAMLKQRAESAKRLPPTPKKDKAVPTKPRGERGPGTGVRKARSLITDIQAELHTLEADLKSLGLQDLAAQFPQLAKQVAATTKAIEAVKTNLRNAEDALKGLEKPKEDVKEAAAPKESVKEVAEQKRTAADLRVAAKQKVAESSFAEAFDKQSQDPTTDDYTNVVHGLSAALGKFGYKIDPKVLDTTYGHIVSSVGEKAQTAKEAAIAALTRMVPISFLPRGQSATEKLERMGDDIELVTALSKLAGETEEKRQGRIDAYEKAGEKLVPRAKFESAAQAQKVRSELEKLKEERRKEREKQYGAQSEVRAIRGQKGAMEILEAQAKAPMAKPTKPVETPEQEQQRETKEAKEQLKSDIDWMNTLPIKDQRDVIEKNERQLSDKARAAYDEARKSGKPVDKELPYKQRLAAERALEMQKQFTKNWEKSPAGKEAKEIGERRKALAEKLAKEKAEKGAKKDRKLTMLENKLKRARDTEEKAIAAAEAEAPMKPLDESRLGKRFSKTAFAAQKATEARKDLETRVIVRKKILGIEDKSAKPAVKTPVKSSAERLQEIRKERDKAEWAEKLAKERAAKEAAKPKAEEKPTKDQIKRARLEAQKRKFMEDQEKARAERAKELAEAQPKGTATKWGPSKLTVIGKSGKEIKIAAYTKGSWAVHEDPKSKYGAFIITHIPTGMSASVPLNSSGEAKAILDRALEKHPKMLGEEGAYISNKAHDAIMDASTDWHKSDKALSDDARPSTWTEGPIAISGDKKVKAHGERLGVLGLHRTVTTGVGGGASWSLTHHPSGFLLKSFNSEKEAKAYTKVMLEKAPSLARVENTKDLVKYRDVLERGVGIDDLRKMQFEDPEGADAKKAMEEAKAQYEDVKSQPTKK